jgi:four helix bundle protein
MRCERLDVWKRACRLSVHIYKDFATCKDYGFKDQITRSSLSIGSNIAEGMEKESDKDKNRFINIAQGSTAELITQIYIGIEVGYIEKRVGMTWIKEANEILKMLNVLKKNYDKTN